MPQVDMELSQEGKAEGGLFGPCPHCRTINGERARECRNCGLIFAKWGVREFLRSLPRRGGGTLDSPRPARRSMMAALALACLAAFLSGDAAQPDSRGPSGATSSQYSGSGPVETVQPDSRGPSGATLAYGAPVRDALLQAKAGGKLVLIEVHGDWCPESAVWDQFFAAYPDLAAARDARYVTLRVNVNQHDRAVEESVLASLPESNLVPRFYVLDSNGRLFNMIDRGDFDHNALLSFLNNPPGRR